MPGSRSRSRGHGGQIQRCIGFLFLLLVLLRSELAAAEGDAVSLNKSMVVIHIKMREILDAELLLACRGGEEEGRRVEGCGSVDLLLDGRGGEGEKLCWASSSASTTWRFGVWATASAPVVSLSLFDHHGDGAEGKDAVRQTAAAQLFFSAFFSEGNRHA
jgi:hypothetical protein